MKPEVLSYSLDFIGMPGGEVQQVGHSFRPTFFAAISSSAAMPSIYRCRQNDRVPNLKYASLHKACTSIHCTVIPRGDLNRQSGRRAPSPSQSVGVFISRKKEDRDDDEAEELSASTSRYVGGINNSPVSAIEDSIVAFVPRGPKSVRVTNLSLFRQKITRSNCPKSGSRAPLISRTEGTEILKHF